MSEITPEKKQKIFEKAMERYGLPQREPSVIEKKEIQEASDQEKKALEQELGRQRKAISEELKVAAEKQAERLKDKPVEHALEELLVLASQKGLAAARTAALKTKNPQLIDLFHDLMARQGFFKRFLD